jgi:hypothetical protein
MAAMRRSDNRTRLICACLLSSSFLAMGCVYDGLPAVKSGRGHINVVFLQKLILSKYVPEPLTGLAWRQSELVGPTKDLAQIALVPSGPPLEVYYEQLNPDWHSQHEVMFFARDPEETFETLRKSLNDDSGWRVQVNSEFLPHVLTLNYPNADGFTPQQEIHLFPTATTFWPGPAPLTPRGPGALPRGSGSIKAVRVVNHGLCSTELPMQPILDQVSDKLWDEFKAKIQNASNCLDQERFWSHATSFLHQTTDFEPAQFGGFLLNFFYHTIDKHTGIKDDNVRLNVHYWFRLRDGRLTLESTYNDSDVNGGSADEIAAGVVPALLTDPGDEIFKQADSSQQYHGLDLTPDQSENPYPCTLRGPDRKDSTLRSDDTPSACQGLIDLVVNDAKFEGGKLTPPLSTDETDTMTRTALHSTVVGGEPIFDNVRCAPFGGGDGAGRCEYIVRAKRLNVYPDAVEVVFLDGDREIGNPTYPVWLSLNKVAPLVNGNPLCGRHPSASPTGWRRFVSSMRGFDHVDSNFSRLQCAF